MSHQHISESLSMEWDLETWVINSTFTVSVVYPTPVADSIILSSSLQSCTRLWLQTLHTLHTFL